MENGLDMGGRENVEMLIERNVQQKSLDMKRIRSRAWQIYARLVERYDMDAVAYLKWIDMNKSYLYLILMSRAMGISVAEL